MRVTGSSGTERRGKPQPRQAWERREILLKPGQAGQLFTDILTHAHRCGPCERSGDSEEATELLVTGVGGDVLGDPAETGLYF